MRITKKAISLILAVMMIASLFVAVPVTAGATTASYVKVTSAPSDGDWSGDYLIVYEDGAKAYNGGTSSSNYIDVTISDGAIASDSATNAAKVTIAKISGGYSIKTAGGNYIGGTSGTNGINTSSDNAYVNSISLDGGDAHIVSDTSVFRYNTTWPGFRYYKSSTYSSQKTVQLYKLTDSAADDGYIAEEDYLTFTAQEDNSSVMMDAQSGSDFQYNKNGTGWQNYNPDNYDRIYLNKGEYVRFRGSEYVSNYAGGSFEIGGKVEASGNIMSLRLDDNGKSQGLTTNCFHNMFERCYGLITAPELPETTLADYCYEGMFNKCTSLTAAPELPATALTYGCYSEMFNGCTSLTEAPALPATSLAYGCYHSMFEKCTSLTELPELRATSLAEACYYGMFDGCSNIRISNQSGTYDGIKYSEEYRIPTEGTATNASYALDFMFASTGGRFKGTPSLNTTYYIGKPVYTVTWKNGDNVIETDTEVESGATPTFNGTTPEKAEDETNTYTFSGWSDGTNTYAANALPKVSGNVIYTAQFTATPKHTHDMTAHEAVAATCTTAGTSAYWECTGCGKFFSDEDGNNEIDDIDAWLAEGGDGYVAATGHNKTHYPAVAATFDAAGNIEYWYCDRCEKYFSDENCENEITQAQTVIAVRAHEILSDADFAYAAANGGTDWYLKADVNADGVTVANNLKIWNNDKTHTISGDITIADGCEFAVAGKKTTNLTGKVTLAGQDSKATSLRTPEIILTQPYKSGQVYGSPASTIITYNGRKIIYDATSLTAAAKNGGEYYVVDDIAISGATTVKADLTITGLKEDGSTPVITVSAPTSAKPFCLFNLSSGVDITIENVDFAATLSNTKTVGVVSADLNSSAASYNTVTITDSEISGFSVSDGYGAVYLHGYTQAVLTDVEMSGNGKYDVWAGSEATVTINGGSYETIFLHSYSGTGAVLDSTDATIGELELDNTVTTRLNATINSGTVTTITESGDGDPLPAEVVVYDPANATVAAPADYKWVDSEESGMKTLVPKEYVAQVNDGQKYETLAEAIAAAADGDTITVLADTTVPCYTTKITGKAITIDATGYTVTGSGPYTSFATMFTVESTGGLTLTGGTFSNPGGIITNKGTAAVAGATLTAGGFAIQNKGDLTISSGTITATEAAITNGATTAETTITGGNFTGKIKPANDGDGSIAISGGTFDRDVDIYAAPGYVGTQLSATTFGVKVDTNPLGTAPIIGFQKKAGVLSGNDINTQGVRIVTKVEGCDLTKFDEYGYVVAKVTGKEQASANFNNLKAYGGNGEKTIKCNGTVNTIDGYGTPYVTLAVNGMTDGQQVAARFYAIKDGVTYYSNYVSTARYNGIIATY